MPYRGLDSGPRESGERLIFAVAFAGIVLYDYHMSEFIANPTLEQLEAFFLEPEEDEGHPPHDMYALAHTNPRAYQQWLDAR
jgi:hypothetical protein